jgi:hypothetical protein
VQEPKQQELSASFCIVKEARKKKRWGKKFKKIKISDGFFKN